VIRKGSWLGTEFPFKKGWIIEPISDSTLYPAYYLISHYVNQEKLSPEEMTVEFFDYVFLGKGKPKNELWNKIRQEVEYWYPVDINLGGKEHKTVHFPVFVMNHVAVFPPEKRPKGIFVHWWVTQKGKEKISKSKGGAEPIIEATTVYGVDAMRLYYAHVGSPFVDVEWDAEIVTKYKNRILSIWRLLSQLQDSQSRTNPHLDTWLQSTIHRRIQAVHEAFDTFDLRVAANEVFFEIAKDVQWYLKRDGGNKKTLREVIEQWIRLMCPFTPHLSEELWQMLGKKPFVSTQPYPEHDTKVFAEHEEVGEYLLSKVIDDTNEIIKVTQITPKTIVLLVSPKWKYHLYQLALQLYAENKLEMGTLMKSAMADARLRPYSKQLSQIAGNLIGDMKKLSDVDRHRYQLHLDEFEYLTSALPFLEKTLAAQIKLFFADDEKKHDPAGKARYAIPLRPAIFVE